MLLLIIGIHCMTMQEIARMLVMGRLSRTAASVDVATECAV